MLRPSRVRRLSLLGCWQLRGHLLKDSEGLWDFMQPVSSCVDTLPDYDRPVATLEL